MLFQNCIPIKNSDISPRLIKMTNFLSKTIGRGVALQGATKKPWHNVAQSCLHQQDCNPHSYDDSYEVKYEEMLNANGFTVFKGLPSVAFHTVY